MRLRNAHRSWGTLLPVMAILSGILAGVLTFLVSLSQTNARIEARQLASAEFLSEFVASQLERSHRQTQRPDDREILEQLASYRNLLFAASVGRRMHIFAATKIASSNVPASESPLGAWLERIEASIKSGEPLTALVADRTQVLAVHPFEIPAGQEALIAARRCALVTLFDLNREKQRNAADCIRQSVVVAAPIVLIGGLCGLVLAGTFTRRMTVLRGQIAGLQRSDEEPPTPLSGNGELALLSSTLLEMQSRIRQQQRELAASETRFRCAVTYNPYFVIYLHRNGTLTFVNQKFADFAGETPEQLEGADLLALVPSDEHATVVRLLHCLSEEMEPGEHQFSISGKNNATRLTRWMVSSIPHPAGTRPLYQAIGEDLSLLTGVTDELIRTQKLVSKTFMSVEEAVFTVDPADRTITMCNQAVKKVLGYEPEELIGRNTRVVHIDDQSYERFGAISEPVLEEQSIYHDEYQLRHKDGSRVPVEILVTPLYDEHGWPRGVISVVRDLTERRAAQQALTRSERKLREANVFLELRVQQRTLELSDRNAELQAYANTIAHDLRAPLRAMAGFSIALMEDYADQLDERGREYLQDIVDSARQLDDLINDLLQYSRLGRAVIQLDDIDLNSVVDQALHLNEAAIRERNAEVSVEPDLPAVRGHRETAVQIFSNLISNAVKFVPKERQPKVSLRSERTDAEMVRLWIEDNGIGIRREDISKIFDVFERLHGVESFPGTGIGLAIVARACRRLGGACDVESTPDVGSRFRVELPRAESPPSPLSN